MTKPTWHNRESCNDLTPFWTSNRVGAECAGAGAGGGNAEILDLFAIFGDELDKFRLDIGVVWPTFFRVRSDSVLLSMYEYFFPFFSVCFRQIYFSISSVFCVEAVVDLDICSSVNSISENITKAIIGIVWQLRGQMSYKHFKVSYRCKIYKLIMRHNPFCSLCALLYFHSLKIIRWQNRNKYFRNLIKLWIYI